MKSSFLCNMKKNYNMQEIETIIETELRKGKTQREIEKIAGICVDYVRRITKQLVEKGIITQEEIEQARKEKLKIEFIEDTITQSVLKYVKAGLPQDDIARLVGKAQGVVSRKIKLLKEYGIISQEEIDEAREKYKKELKDDNFTRDAVLQNLLQGRRIHHFAQEIGLTDRGAKLIQDSLIAEGKITQEEINEAIKTKGKKAKNEEQIIELLKQGYNLEEISGLVNYATGKIRTIKEKAISEGKITEEEYNDAKNRRRGQLKKEDQKSKDNEELEQQVLEMLRIGKSTMFIRKKLGITISNVRKIIQKLIKREDLTESEIKEAKERYAKEVREKILLGVRKGYTQMEIVKMFEEGEFSQKSIQKYIVNLISQGVITEEQIKKYKFEAEQGEKELQEFVLKGVKQGLSIEAMASMDETGHFTTYRIETAMKRMKEQGILTNRQIKKTKSAKTKERRKETEKRLKKIDKKLIRLLLEGETLKEIEEILGYAESTITKKITRLKAEGKITQEQIVEARQNRKQREKIEKEKQREIEKQKKKEQEVQEMQNKKEEEKSYNLYKKYLKKLQIIFKLESHNTTEEENHQLISETICLAVNMQQNGKLEVGDLKIIADAIFILEKVDVNDILKLARMYIKSKNYQNAIYLLNSSKNFLEEEEDHNKVDIAVENIKLFMRRKQADILLREGHYKLEDISKSTGLSILELIRLREKQTSQQANEHNKEMEETEDDVFLDIN